MGPLLSGHGLLAGKIIKSSHLCAFGSKLKDSAAALTISRRWHDHHQKV